MDLKFEQLVRPCDYDLYTFEELIIFFNDVLKDTTANIKPLVPIAVIKVITSYVICSGFELHMAVDIYWPKNTKVYKGIVVCISKNKQTVHVRYTGWRVHHNEAMGINEMCKHAHMARPVGLLFPAGYRTAVTRVGCYMCKRSKKAQKHQPCALRIGMRVVHNDRDKYLLMGQIVGFDYECTNPLKIKLGYKLYKYVSRKSVRVLREPPKAWKCVCGEERATSIQCAICGGMWPGL